MNARLCFLLLLAGPFLTSPALAAGQVDSQVANVGVSISYDSTLDLEAASQRAESDLWQRMRAGMKLGDLDSPLVDRQISWFLDHPAYLEAASKRARLFLYHITEQVEARGLPMELALLPVVESAYNPRALSHANASGIWQFMPATGRIFGLKQNGWYDGRQDVLTATDAALDYLAKLKTMFGDWQLALAAYNCGEGCVTRAIARNQTLGQPTDYRSLDLPAETRNYVPRLLAVRNLILEPERYGVRLADIPNRPYFEKVSLPYPIEARTAARMADVDMDELLELNPGFRRHVIHAESQDTLLLPVDKVDTFRAAFDAEESHKIRLRSYVASKGELLSRIADRFDVTVKWLQDHNPLSVKRGKLAQAQTLFLPPSAARPMARPVATTTRKVARPSVRKHTVRRGDTLFSLAKRYKVSIADIRELNGAIKVLHPGEKINIPLDS
ncbi:LysM peptidoglycan-binding domain-containing protein [Parasulfuritortus cantonensis]|uniref:LysM peptidoglycan-binding domain-containing protein n=1 Tax=Parasulfuritortus cantonensis TaxID=2528202 RepID=A0A4R1B956_9PROT|nr:transglycosylase SLT domain-containing protein [Parasulfuritortus cantonensis]TCJ13193.1 LysM peptidoglycan-binding domain-containing protein [Parasulfuritortus cantonensis]